MSFDTTIVIALNNLIGLSRWSDLFWLFVTDYLGYLLVLGVVLYWFKERENNINANRDVLFVGLSIICSRVILTEIIRYIWYRPRPLLVIPNLHILVREASASFPSGHAAVYFSLALALYYLNKKIGAWYLGSALLIGISRVVLGVHYPTDIIGGFLVAWVSVSAMKYLQRFNLS